MNKGGLFVVGIIAAIVVMGFAFARMGGPAKQSGGGYRGVRSTPSTSTTTAASTAATPTQPTTTDATPSRPSKAEGRLLRPGAADGATKEMAASGMNVLKGAPGRPDDREISNTYTVPKGGESVYDVARKWLGDEDLWRPLYDANRTVIANPDKIREGTMLDRPTDLEKDDGIGKPRGIGSGIR